MHNLYLFQTQDLIIVNDQQQYWLPYSAGCVWAYAQQFEHIRSRWNLKEIFFKKMPLDDVEKKIINPTVCAFSVYVWNRHYTIAVAKMIKEKWPECILVFGGPEVSSSWLQYEFVDCLILGEGERSFLKVLETISEGKKPEIIVKSERMDSLDNVPSPYVTGIFDSIVKENLGVSWCAPFETNRGCPYSCTFCDWGGLTQSKVKKFKLERVVSEIEWMRKNNVKVIFITDANFGIFKERDFEITKLLKTWIDEKNGLEYVHMNYAKNSNKHMIDIAEILGSASKGITLSVQTMNQDTLRIIKRENMKINNISEIMRLAKERNVQFYTELMLGLPEETLESWKSGFDQLLELGQHNRIEIFPVTLMENTELNSSQKIQYKLKSIPVENVVGWGKNESNIAEYYPTICETSTMTTLELVEGFAYYWMITNFHIIGYSQILAKYCRYVHNISYRKFYDKLFENIQKTVDNVSYHEYNKINNALISIYTTGKCGTADDKNSTITSTFHTTMYEFYANIDDILKISIETAKECCEVDEGIIEIQKRFILNDVYEPNCTITANFDIDTWEKSTSLYKIESSLPNLELNHDTIAIKIRRTKALRNKIYKINLTDI